MREFHHTKDNATGVADNQAKREVENLIKATKQTLTQGSGSDDLEHLIKGLFTLHVVHNDAPLYHNDAPVLLVD